jgi:hypothetical protein
MEIPTSLPLARDFFIAVQYFDISTKAHEVLHFFASLREIKTGAKVQKSRRY